MLSVFTTFVAHHHQSYRVEDIRPIERLRDRFRLQDVQLHLDVLHDRLHVSGFAFRTAVAVADSAIIGVPGSEARSVERPR